MQPRTIEVELLPHERAALLGLRFSAIDDARDQLLACAASRAVETITFAAADIHFLAGDLTHAIVKRGCRDEDIINLSERFDYIDDTGDGSLAAWY